LQKGHQNGDICNTIQVLRAIAISCSIPVWLFYLLDHNDRIPAKVLGVILTAAYMVFKGKSILKTALAWKVAASKLMQSTVSIF